MKKNSKFDCIIQLTIKIILIKKEKYIIQYILKFHYRNVKKNMNSKSLIYLFDLYIYN